MTDNTQTCSKMESLKISSSEEKQPLFIDPECLTEYNLGKFLPVNNSRSIDSVPCLSSGPARFQAALRKLPSNTHEACTKR